LFRIPGLKQDLQVAASGCKLFSVKDSADRNKPANEAIAEMARRIAVQFHPDRVILFGSYARGTAGPDSDVDLLVVMPANGSRRERAVEIDVALSGIKLPADVIVVTPEDIERDRQIPGTLIRPALNEGKVLYERSA
jgi:predicted nucleotidyltransferase